MLKYTIIGKDDVAILRAWAFIYLHLCLYSLYFLHFPNPLQSCHCTGQDCTRPSNVPFRHRERFERRRTNYQDGKDGGVDASFDC